MENKNQPNDIKYSIWETRTKEDVDITKEKILEAMDHSDYESKTTSQKEER
jgi:hypothetical protein